jgi:aminopeptidase N
MKLLFFTVLYLFCTTISFAQEKTFTRFDTLRGSISSLRSSYDVHFYSLSLSVDIDKKTISGCNQIFYSATDNFTKIQVDLFSQYTIDSIVYEHELLSFVRDSNTIYVKFKEEQPKGSQNKISVYYSGKPIVARNAPWDGGFVWDKDSLGNPWIGVACEGLGASSWWPCKDHPSDEPDSMQMTFNVPSDLMCVSNGNLNKTTSFPNKRTSYTWNVKHPINTYNVSLNIGKYSHFSDTLPRKNQTQLALDYYVLQYNKTKAQKHFSQVKKILYAFESFFGEYPFPSDGYALVETPYWGMEHQSAIAYGNNYENKLADFDFIIAHETAHEWWGNSVTASDMGHLWIQESFATYAESLLLERYYGSATSINYLLHQKKNIKNENPMLRPAGVNAYQSEDSDIYYKGAWMLHSLRNTVADDTLWKKLIFGLSSKLHHSVVSTDDVIKYFNDYSKMNLSPIFEQYLKYSNLPVFEYSFKKKSGKVKMTYRWKANAEGFNMPVIIETQKNKNIRLQPTAKKQEYVLTKTELANLRILTELFLFQVAISSEN